MSETPERQRERLRQEEIKSNPTGNLRDGMNRAEAGSLTDLVGDMGWKGTGVLILVILVGYIVYSIFFK